MKKSLLALAALAAFASAASAQSSVTLYGRVDLSVGKGIGSDNKSLGNGSGSRVGLRGVEDLGGGLSAIFNIEHRYQADTGAIDAGGRFWRGRSFVGLKGGFGEVKLGREYTTSFLMNQLPADPFGWDNVPAGTLGGVGLTDRITGGRIAKVRNDSSITYNVSAGGFGFGIQTAEATDALTTYQNRPLNFAVSYKGGPVMVSLGYEKTGEEAAAEAKWTTLLGQYDLGAVKLGAFYGTGNTAANADHKSYMLTATAPIGGGELRFAYGKLENETAGVDADKGFALGYHYFISKRTTLYADVARNTGVTVGGQNETGYDIGIKHNF